MRCTLSRTFNSLLTLTLIALLNVGGSCASDGNHHDHHDGWSSNRPRRIPDRADEVREGSGKLKWTADMNGVVYIFDRDKDEVRYTGDVRRGEEVVVQPESDRIYVDGRIVYDRNLEKHSTHKIYFLSDGNRDR